MAREMREGETGRRRSRGRGSLAWGTGLLLLLSKGKGVLLLLLKFGKPLLSLAITVGTYALFFPWTFALGFVALLFIHELGHVWVARRKGLPVSAPIFIPFLGAMILLKRHPKDARTEASVALGGPALGFAGSLACLAIALWTGSAVWNALAYVGAFVNLINLLPIHPLDGGRIAVAVSRWLWVAGVVLVPIAIWYTGSYLFAILWFWFLWEMFRRFFGDRRPGRPHFAEGVFLARPDPDLPAWYLSGQTHRRELPFTAYCRMDGLHVAEFWWEPLSFRGRLEFVQPCTIKGVRIVAIGEPNADGLLPLRVRADALTHEPENYYEVPAAARWLFGIGYGGLAAGLLAMMWWIGQWGLDL